MAAPVNDDTFSGGFGGASSHAYAPTFVARTAALVVFVVCYEQTNGTPNSITSITDSNGITYTKHSSVNFLGATSSNITGPVYTAIEVWSGQGNITAGAGTITMNFSIAVDHSCFVGYTYHGHNAAKPFDNNASFASSTFSGNATAAVPQITLSTTTSNVILYGAIGSCDNQVQSGPLTFNGVNSDVGTGTSFSSGGSWFSFIRAEGKNHTSPAVNEVVAGASKFNQLMIGFGITADVQVTPGLGTHGTSIC